MAKFATLQLRTRVAVIASVAVALAVVVVAGAAYALTRSELLGQLDDSLESRVAQFGRGPLLDVVAAPGRTRIPGGGPGEFDALHVQLVASNGETLAPFGDDLELPVDPVALAVAGRTASPSFRTVEVDGVRLRVYTAPLVFEGRRGFGGNIDNIAVQVARSTSEVDASLSRLGWVLLFGGVLGVVAAAGLGLVVARSALRPIAILTRAAETVTETQDLASTIDVASDDEVGRLATAFNSMLAALNESRVQQRRLVRDASHELRTPLTALRTNIEMLARGDEMSAAERRHLIDDATHEVEELTALVTELVDLATATDIDEVPTTVDLGEIAEAVADRYRRRAGRAIVVAGDPPVIEGKPSALDRAVRNLVDNAVKWSDDTITISVDDTPTGVRLAVEDNGVGIADEDRSRVFERFYRGERARTTAGSGLGLAIVERVVADHGGATFVEASPSGGAIVGFVLPRDRSPTVTGE